MITDEELQGLIKKCLADFYRRRLATLTGLRLKDALTKNPYLFRAMGVKEPAEIIAQLLQARVSSSDETHFGDAFFEPIVLAVSGGHVSGATGVDVEIETDNQFKAIAVKSGTNAQNASAQSKQNQEFNELRSRLHKIGKHFDAVIGYCYGRTTGAIPKGKIYRRLAGQAFWEELTGDANFYLKLMRFVGEYPAEHRREYEAEFDQLVSRFNEEFKSEFSALDGGIDWEKLIAFNSSKERPKNSKFAREVAEAEYQPLLIE